MISNLDPASEIFIAGIDAIQQRVATANSQITSGKKIQVASDAPDQIDSLLQMRADLQRNSQIKSNLSLAQTDAQGADNALSASIQLMDQAVQLGAEGANSTQTAAARQTLGAQVATLLNQMVSNSQTQVQGRYIFSGDSDQSPTYQPDPAAAKGVDQLSNAASTRQIEDPAGGSFQASKTAQQIFDDTNPDGTAASDNVFAALQNLATALNTSNQAGINSALDNVNQASSHLNDMEAFYGNTENRITAATTFAGNYDTQLQTQLSTTEDADVTSAALQLTQDNTQLQAAFEAEGKRPMQSLFNYLG
jgi:flagellar hook-associated protein 3 FlgL